MQSDCVRGVGGWEWVVGERKPTARSIRSASDSNMISGTSGMCTTLSVQPIPRYKQVSHRKSSHCFSETGTSSCTESASGTTSCFNVNLSPDATTANQVGAFNVVSAQAERKPAAFFRPELASHGGCANSVAVRVLRLLLLLLWFPPTPRALCPGSRVFTNFTWICFLVC